jgi:hypothetical protein
MSNPNHDDFHEFMREEGWYDGESMDGDHDSAMTSAGWGTDEDYGLYETEDN